MEHALELMAGICFLALGISSVWRAEDWIHWAKNQQAKGRNGSLSLGMIALLFGSFILAFHPVWQGLPLVLTLLGVLAIIKGCMMLAFPGWLPGQLERLFPHLKLIIKIKGALLMLLGAALLSSLH